MSVLLKTNQYRNYLGKKFRNYVFKKRLDRKKWSTKLIIFVMGILDKNQIYINDGDVGNFDHYVPTFLLNRWRVSEHGEKKEK